MAVDPCCAGVSSAVPSRVALRLPLSPQLVFVTVFSVFACPFAFLSRAMVCGLHPWSVCGHNIRWWNGRRLLRQYASDANGRRCIGVEGLACAVL